MSVDLRPIEELERELEVRDARDRRDRALASNRMRRKQTRARIVLGGAILAEIRDIGDPEFIRKIIAILDERVTRERDRETLGNMIGALVPQIPIEHFPASGGLPDFAALEEAAIQAGAVERLLPLLKREVDQASKDDDAE